MGENGNPEQDVKTPDTLDTATSTGDRDYDVSNFLKNIEENMPKDADAVEYYKNKLIEAEKRRRGTVAGFTKSQQQLKAVEAQASFLRDKVAAQIKLTPEQQEELDTLKLTNPDQWRTKIDAYEVSAKKQFEDGIVKELERIKSLSAEEFERERLAEQLSEFITANPELNLTKDEIADQIPPLYMKRLARGEISFEEFLGLTKKFLTAPEKTLARDVPSANGTNISGVRGSSNAPAKAEVSNILDNEKTITF
jgi:hypothetical protein|nr:MAG TPA: hypothetical protein [Caudoviricetes sp.]